ncbi:hypothetical protein WG901_08335 [Novosphingobium sp. PS1R-30]|uniref:Uncharacterized protein n=1 Tax=Novosphingobium anseongense TaxID=3133436 RepID=A0ABU8RV32_9SPHN
MDGILKARPVIADEPGKRAEHGCRDPPLTRDLSHHSFRCGAPVLAI